MTVNELANVETAINNPAAVAIYVASLMVAGLLVNASTKYGWRATKWTASKVRARFRSPPLSDQAAAVVALLTPNEPADVWQTGDLPTASSRKTPNGATLTVKRPTSYVDAFLVIEGNDLLYGLPKAERKTVAKIVVALLDDLTKAAAIARVTPTKTDGSVVQTAKVRTVDALVLGALATVSVKTPTYAGSLDNMRDPYAGSAPSGGMDMYVFVPVNSHVRVAVRVAVRTTEAERYVINAYDAIGNRLELVRIAHGASPQLT